MKCWLCFTEAGIMVTAHYYCADDRNVIAMLCPDHAYDLSLNGYPMKGIKHDR